MTGTGVVYFVKCRDGLVKIGLSRRVRGRLGQIGKNVNGPLCLLSVVRGSHCVEKAFHKFFKAEHVINEWFRISDAQITDAVNRYRTNPQVFVDSLIKQVFRRQMPTVLHCYFCGHDWPTKGQPSRCPACFNPVGRKPLSRKSK